MSVYFVQSVIGGPIKIGFAINVAKRISALRTGCPFELRLLCSIPGGRREEHALHRAFASLHAGGEWFRPEGILLEKIRSLGAEPSPARAWVPSDSVVLRSDRSGARRWRVGARFSEGARLAWVEIVDRGLSQGALCRALKLRAGSVNRWLWGLSRPAYKARERLLQVLGIPPVTWFSKSTIDFKPPSEYPTMATFATP